MTVPTELDTRFRAATTGLVDVAYDFADSPLGPLFVAATERGLCRLSFDAEPEAEEERLARGFGARVLRSPRALDEVRRELDDYFEGRRQAFELPVDLRPVGDFQRAILGRLVQVPYGSVTTYGKLATESGRPRAARAVGMAMNRNPVPIVLPCHRVVGAGGDLVGYGGGLDRKVALLKLEGVQL
ncbi:MAG: methylated-DNA--[protein]-cysteine S-methyltransferase [Gaiellaceae bacterium]